MFFKFTKIFHFYQFMLLGDNNNYKCFKLHSEVFIYKNEANLLLITWDTYLSLLKNILYIFQIVSKLIKRKRNWCWCRQHHSPSYTYCISICYKNTNYIHWISIEVMELIFERFFGFNSTYSFSYLDVWTVAIWHST